MPNFEKDLRNFSDEELYNKINRDNWEFVHIYSEELTRRLINSIKHLDETTSRYSKVLIWLTVGLGIFALIQIVLFLIK